MLECYYDSVICIATDLWIGKKDYFYDFGYEGRVILSGCINFSYVSGKIIAFKKDSKIIVFSTKIKNNFNLPTPEKLLEFTAYSHVAYGKIICENYTYLIDGNCQIKFSERPHIC